MTSARAATRTTAAADPQSDAATGHGSGFGARQLRSAVPVGVGLAVVAVALVAQVSIGLDRLALTGFLGAAEASGAARLHVLAVTVVLALAWALPSEWRRCVPAAAAVVPLGVLVTTGLHGVAWSAAVTTLLVAAMYGAGVQIIRLLGLGRLPLLVSTATGFAAIALAVQLLGRVGLLRWWTLGVPVMLAGAVVLVAGARRNARAVWTRWPQLQLSVTGAVVVSLLLLQLAWALVYAAAPEIQYDALSAKSALPQLWADTGRIETPLEQPGFGVLGSAQNVAVVGWLVGAEAVGRYLQLVLAAVVVIALGGRARSAGPAGWCVALALGVMPHYTWQASTAYDDNVLLFVCAAAAAAVLILGERDERSLGASVLVGALAGSIVTAKLHLLVFAAVLAAGWVFVRPAPLRERLKRLGMVVVGGVAVAGPVPLFRYLDSGNPVFPLFNGIFKSPYLSPTSNTANLPYSPRAGLDALLDLPYVVTAAPTQMVEAQPPGAFGFILVLLVVGLAVAWRRGRASALVAAAALTGLVSWWLQLRYLRYLIPYAGVAAVLLVYTRPAGRPFRSGRAGDILTALACALLSAACFASLLASFWNVPERVPKDFVLGEESPYDYQARTIPGFVVLQDVNGVAGRGDVVVTDLYARSVLRPDLEVSSSAGLETRFNRVGISVDTVPELLAGYRSVKAHWIAVSTEQRVALDPTSVFANMLREHGALVSVGGSYELYRLDDRSAEAVPQPLCDFNFVGQAGVGTGSACWGMPLDAEPGLTAAEAPRAASQTVAVCPGASYALDVKATTPGAVVVLTFSQSENLRGAIQRYSRTVASAAGVSRAVASAPARGRTMFIEIEPGNGRVLGARLYRVAGPAC